MTWIERTAYPRLPRAVSLKELRESFTPGDDEMAWARAHTQSDRHLLALVVWLKCYQRLGYFPPAAAIPASVIDHVRAALGLDAGVTAGYDVGRTGTRHRDYVRARVGAVWEPARARAVAETAMREALLGKDNPADVINVALEALAAAGCELPGYSTLDEMAATLRAEVNGGFCRTGPCCSHRGAADGSPQEPLAWYGDSAYGTGDLRGAIADAGHQAVIKPKPLRPPVKGGLTVDDFSVDEQAGTVTCPAGNTVALSRTRVATFGALCRDCPLRSRCTTCKTGRKLVLHPRDDLLRAARRDWAATGQRKDYMAWRPNVERAIAQVATFRGRRLKLRYRGVTKNHAWLSRRTAALNLRALAGMGLTRRDGAWALAT